MMIRFRLLLLAFTFSFPGIFAQTLTPAFEGEIVYANKYTAKNPKLNAKQLTIMLGSEHHYFIRNGDYKTVTNGSFALWQLYINKNNKIYNKMATSDTLFYNEGQVHDDELLSTKLNKNAVTILGYMCDELIMTFRSGVHKYYYNSKLRVDSKLYVNHKYGNYYNYISVANAVPLKMIVADSEVIMESTATKIEAKKLPADFFNLPPNVKTALIQY